MPISQTAAVCAGVVANTLSGTPMWLFKLPWVAATRKCWDSTAAEKSLVLVLPLEPVMATTGSVSCCRHQQASRCSASKVSGTTMTAVPSGAGPLQACTTATRAPPARAAAAKPSPSNVGPRMAKNTAPCGSLRVSVATPPLASTAGLPAATATPRMAASCCALRGCIACRRWPGPARATLCWRACDHRSRCCGRRIVGSSHGPCRR